HGSPIPYYIQVIEALKDRIGRGEWHVVDQLPGEQVLCDMFDVSRTVIRQVLESLRHEGLIVRRKGRGTFVAEPKISESLVARLIGFYQDMTERGLKPETRVLKQQIIPAGKKVGSRLGIMPETPVIEIERLRSVNGEPIQLVVTYLPYNLCQKVIDADFSDQSLYAFLEAECGLYIARGLRVIEAVLANEIESELLGIARGAPLVLIDSVSYLEDGTPMEYYRARHRGDRSKFEVEMVRMRERTDMRDGVDDPSI
ncbi:MAG: GntR family transcriptional regulator, partial [Anaerolineae bacterium]|nr:GntR family transcriptional regulator [Anaerolineae bacterium]